MTRGSSCADLRYGAPARWPIVLWYKSRIVRWYTERWWALIRGQSRPNGGQEGVLAERLEQAVDGAICQHLQPDLLVAVGGDKNEGNGAPALDQLPLQLGPPHARHA